MFVSHQWEHKMYSCNFKSSQIILISYHSSHSRQLTTMHAVSMLML